MRVLILGVTGMLGHKLFNLMSLHDDFDVYGVARNIDGLTGFYKPEFLKRIKSNINAEKFDSLLRTIANIKPDVVINCINSVGPADYHTMLTVNSLLPHRIALVCQTTGARLIHISTDHVFDGVKGKYRETDIPDAKDLYGRSKNLGEVDYPNCVTLRISTIGHEIKGKCGLVEWFLAQEEKVKGQTGVIYTAVPTTEFAHIISNYIIPNGKLSGLYHVSTNPISKYELLKLIATIYGKKIEIEPDDCFVSDRSLNSSMFREQTKYVTPEWPILVSEMYDDYFNYSFGKKIGG